MTAGSTKLNFCQYLNTSKWIEGAYTLSFHCNNTNNIIELFFTINGDDGGTGLNIENNTIYTTFNLVPSITPSIFGITVKPNTSVIIHAAKLEVGNKQTLTNQQQILYTAPNYEEELIKCRYYYYRMRFQGNFVSSAYDANLSSNYVMFYNTNIIGNMYKKPTFIVDSSLSINEWGNIYIRRSTDFLEKILTNNWAFEFWRDYINVINYTTKILDTSTFGYTLLIPILILDAEIY